MRKLPPLSAVRVFEAAARHEHFTAAADELGMTQAAVSYQIRALEERVGVKLFERSKGRVKLTDAGRRLLAPLTDAFDRIDGAFTALRADDENLLSISTTSTFANTWLAWRLGGFQMEHPHLAVKLDANNALVDFAAADVDVAIRAGEGEWPGLHAQQAVRDRLHADLQPLVPEQWKKEHGGRDIEPADLIDLPQVSSNDPWLDHWLRERGVEVPDRPRRPGIQLEFADRRGDGGDGRPRHRHAHPLLLALRSDRGPAGAAVPGGQLARLGLLAGLPRAPPPVAQDQALLRMAAADGARPTTKRRRRRGL